MDRPPSSSSASELSSLPQPSLSPPDEGARLVTKTQEFGLISSLLASAPGSLATPVAKPTPPASAKLSATNLLLFDVKNAAGEGARRREGQ